MFRFTHSKMFQNVVKVYSRRCSSLTDKMPMSQFMGQGERIGFFTKNEVDIRLNKLREYMDQKGLGLVLLSSPHNINYYTGGFINTCSLLNYGLVVTQKDSFTITPVTDGGQPYRRATYAKNLTYTDWHKDNFFATVHKEVKNIKGKIGLELDHISVESFGKFHHEMMAGRTALDVGLPTMQLRRVKSKAEQDVIRNITRIADIGGAVAVDAIKEGVTEMDVSLAATKAMVKEIAKTYPNSELRDTWTLVKSGINTDGSVNPVTTKKIANGDMLSINCFPMVQGYSASLERTYSMGQPTEAHLKNWEKFCEIHNHGLTLFKPGASCNEIARELDEMYAERHLLKYKTFGYGHSNGAFCHYYGRESLDWGVKGQGEKGQESDKGTILTKDMIISFVHMMTIPEDHPGSGGYKEQDILIINENGAENITKTQFGPKSNIIKK